MVLCDGASRVTVKVGAAAWLGGLRVCLEISQLVNAPCNAAMSRLVMKGVNF